MKETKEKWTTSKNHPRLEFNENLEFRYKKNKTLLGLSRDNQYRYNGPYNGKTCETIAVSPRKEVLDTLYNIDLRTVAIKMQNTNDILIKIINMYSKVNKIDKVLIKRYLNFDDIVLDYPELKEVNIKKAIYRGNTVAKQYLFEYQWVTPKMFLNQKK